MDLKQICKQNRAKFFPLLFFLKFIIGTVKNNVYLCKMKTNRTEHTLSVYRSLVAKASYEFGLCTICSKNKKTCSNKKDAYPHISSGTTT